MVNTFTAGGADLKSVIPSWKSLQFGVKVTEQSLSLFLFTDTNKAVFFQRFY
eukprot:m.62673 g.62673  ORF g.62673 m.62673 type:complete len:52 (+) comp35095_c0_seq5:1129-1284(+)